MRSRLFRALACCAVLVTLAGLPADAGAQQPAVARTDSLGWLTGCWERRTATALVEERWTTPGGGILLGTSRTLRSGRLVEFEQLLLRDTAATVVLVARPSGQAEARFTAVPAPPRTLVVENPAHDFPKRIIYRAAPGDSLHARIEGDGRGVDFRYGRVRC